MINVSDKMKEYVLKTGRSFKGKIEVDGQTEYEGIMNIFIDRSMCSDCLNFGEVNSAYCSISVYEPSVSFASKEITAYISAIIDGEDEWVKLGEFTAEKPTVSDKIVEFTAFDCIKYKTDITYFPTLENESAISLVFEDICNQCGVPFLSIDNELTINPAKLSGMKCKDALGQIAGFLGGNIVTDNEGRVTVRYVSECDYTIDEDMMTEPTIGEAVFTLDGILCTVGDDALTCGSTEGNVITFSNVLMTQEQLNSIFAKYQSLTYHSVSVENLVGNPFLEVGDTISMERYGVVYKIPIMHLTIDFDGGVLNDIETYHKTIEEESGGKSVSDVLKDIENIKAENNLSADFANAISNAMGLHYSKQRLEDGSYKIYGHDKDSLAESTYIFTNTAEGFAFVTGEDCWNDGSPEWQYGFSKDGNAILKMLNVHKLTADLITAGKLQSKDGNTYFDLENDEISTLTTDDEGNATTRTLLKDGTFTCADASNFQTTIDSAGLTSINVPIDMTSFPEKPDNWDKLGIIGKILYFMRVLAQYRRGICLVSPCTAEAENVYLNHSNPRANQMVKLDNDFNALQTTEYTAEGITSDGPFYIDNLRRYKRKLTEEDDLDDIVEEGVYFYQTQSLPDNCYYSNAGVVEVIHADSDATRIIQRNTRYGVAGETAFRTKFDGKWNKWDGSHYIPGESISLEIYTSGYVTASGTAVFFVIPLSKGVADGTVVSVSSGSVGLVCRQNGKYTHGSASGSYVKPTYSAWLLDGQTIQVKATLSDTTNVTNNDTIGVQWDGTITFS